MIGEIPVHELCEPLPVLDRPGPVGSGGAATSLVQAPRFGVGALHYLQRAAGNAAVLSALGLARRPTVQRQDTEEQAPAPAADPAGDQAADAEIAISGVCGTDEETEGAGDADPGAEEAPGFGGFSLGVGVQREDTTKGTTPPAGSGQPAAGPPAAGQPCPVPADLATFGKVTGLKPPQAAVVRAGAKAAGTKLTTVLLKSDIDTDRVGLPGVRAGQVAAIVQQCETSFDGGKIGFSVKASTPCGSGSTTVPKAGSKPDCNAVLGAALDKLFEAENPRLLGHEQGHVKLACTVVEQANAKLPATADDKTVKKAEAAANAKINALNKKYDKESKHGCDAGGQGKWDAAIASGKFP